MMRWYHPTQTKFFINTIMNFLKLNKTFSMDDYQKDRTFIFYGTEKDGQKVGIGYSTLKNYDSAEIFSVIPEIHRGAFTLNLMEINSPISPHTDSKILSTINFYILTSNCKTTFYEVLDNSNTWKVNNQTNGAMYPRKDLKEISSFIAEPGDAWLLDVSVPHSVDPVEPGSPVQRSAICLQSTVYNFSQVKEMLVKSGFID